MKSYQESPGRLSIRLTIRQTLASRTLDAMPLFPNFQRL
jgi:hypothetical protein